MTKDDRANDGWTLHRLEQLREVARRTTPHQRLVWLEEALRLAQSSGALGRERRARAKAAGQDR